MTSRLYIDKSVDMSWFAMIIIIYTAQNAIHLEFNEFNKIVDIKFSVHDAFLE